MADLTSFKPEDGKRLPCGDSEERTEYREPASGLRLRVSRSGARTWLVTYWSPAAKTTRRLKLGDGALMPLSKARAAARAILHAVEQEGRDPASERVATRLLEREERRRRAEERRQAARDRARRSVSFGKLCREYVEYRRTTPSGKYERPARPNTLATWESMLKNHILPTIGDRPPEDITSEDFLRVLEVAVKKGGTSSGPRVRELLSAVWKWIAERPRGLGVKLPAVSPLVGLPKVGSAQKERERVLSPAEVWRLWRATDEETLAGDALRLSLLTAARVNESTGLPWSEVDLAAKVWKLPAKRNKSGRDRLIPLSEAALNLLRRVQGRSGSEHVFGDPVRLHELVKRVRSRMGGEHWEPRDLRRTAATLCARLGADPFTVALVLGHANTDARVPAVTSTYLRWDYADKVREALDRLGTWVEDTVTRTTEPGDVVSIEARR
jgi:integrase